MNKHKVFISYYHYDDQKYKDRLEKMNENGELFVNMSVRQDDIEDTSMTDEQIRIEIRDNYIKESTVLIILCGENTKKRKFCDWEIHASMFDTEKNPKMGILLINLPSISSQQCVNSNEERELVDPNVSWKEIDPKNVDEDFPFIPQRIKENFLRENVKISFVDWDIIYNDKNKFLELIDIAYQRRKNQEYDTSTLLRRHNS